MPGTPPAKRKGPSWGKLAKGIKNLGKAIAGSERPKKLEACVPKVISIPIHWNIMATNCSTLTLVNDKVIADAMAAINAAYNPFNIFFTTGKVKTFLAGYDNDYRRFIQNTYDKSFNEPFIMRQQFRSGGKEAVHVFVVESIKNPKGGGRTRGECVWSSIDLPH